MKEFNELVAILERLLAPDGCKWDQEQTLQTLRAHLLEESSEVVEAIHLNDNEKIEEELGDLFFNVIFLCRVAEKEERFTMKDVLNHIKDKLIRRHPHVFGDKEAKNAEEALHHWQEIKKLEKKREHSPFEGIPPDLPTLMKASKIDHRLKKQKQPLPEVSKLDEETALGKKLYEMAAEASRQGLDAELALRKYLALLETS